MCQWYTQREEEEAFTDWGQPAAAAVPACQELGHPSVTQVGRESERRKGNSNGLRMFIWKAADSVLAPPYI